MKKMFIKGQKLPKDVSFHQLNDKNYSKYKVFYGWKGAQYSANETNDNNYMWGFLPPKGYVVVDCDSENAIKTVEHINSITRTQKQREFVSDKVLSWNTKNGKHYLYAVPELIQDKIALNSVPQELNLLKLKCDYKGENGGYVIISDRINAIDIENAIKNNEIPELPALLWPTMSKPINDYSVYPEKGLRDNILFNAWVPEVIMLYENRDIVKEILLALVKDFHKDSGTKQNIKKWINNKVNNSVKKPAFVKNGEIVKIDFNDIVQRDYELFVANNGFKYFYVYNSELYFYDLMYRDWVNYDKYLNGKKEKLTIQFNDRVSELIGNEPTYDKNSNSHRKVAKMVDKVLFRPKNVSSVLEKSVVTKNKFIDKFGNVHTIDKDNIPPFTTVVVHKSVPENKPEKPLELHKLDMAMCGNLENIEKMYDIYSYIIANYVSSICLVWKGDGKCGLGTRQTLHKLLLDTSMTKLKRGTFDGGNQFTLSAIIGYSFGIENEMNDIVSNNGANLLKDIADYAATMSGEIKGATPKDYPLTTSLEIASNHFIKFPTTDLQLFERLVFVIADKKNPLNKIEYQKLKEQSKECIEYLLWEYFYRQVKFLKTPYWNRNEDFMIHNKEYIEEINKLDTLKMFMTRLIEKLTDVKNDEWADFNDPFSTIKPNKNGNDIVDIIKVFKKYVGAGRNVQVSVMKKHLISSQFVEKNSRWFYKENVWDNV